MCVSKNRFLPITEIGSNDYSLVEGERKGHYGTGNSKSTKRSYENSPWINIHDWQVTEHTNSKTNEKFWDIKLAKNTFIEVDGKRIDVSGYHFHTNYEPSVSFGEPGTPRCKRGIHFPEGWNITLQRFENTAPAGELPIFVEAGRIENVTPQQIVDGLADRRAQWKAEQSRNNPSVARNEAITNETIREFGVEQETGVNPFTSQEHISPAQENWKGLMLDPISALSQRHLEKLEQPQHQIAPQAQEFSRQRNHSLER